MAGAFAAQWNRSAMHTASGVHGGVTSGFILVARGYGKITSSFPNNVLKWKRHPLSESLSKYCYKITGWVNSNDSGQVFEK
jgi:hypothetical protein